MRLLVLQAEAQSNTQFRTRLRPPQYVTEKGEAMKAQNKTRNGPANGQFLHGLSKSSEHKIWREIKQRCLNSKYTKWHLYGGRGIKMCEEWQRSFSAFYKHIGPRPNGHSIDRKDRNGHYEPGNVRWATPMEQSRNMRTNNFITFDGRTMIQEDWAKGLGISGNALHYRLGHWPLEAALSLGRKDRVALRFRAPKRKS